MDNTFDEDDFDIHTWVKLIAGLERYSQGNEYDGSDSWETEFLNHYITEIKGNVYLNSAYKGLLLLMQTDAENAEENIAFFDNIPKVGGNPKLVNLSKFVWDTTFTFTEPFNDGVGKDGAYIMEVYDFVLLVNLYNTHLGAAEVSTTPTNATPGLQQNLYKLRM
jgi:hypothetical protein